MIFSTTRHHDLRHHRFVTTVLQGCKHSSVYLLLLLMPTAVFWFFGRPSAYGVTPLLAMPTWYLSDLAVLGLLIISARHLSLISDKTWTIDVTWLSLCLAAVLTALTAFAPHYALYTALRWLLAFVIYRVLLQIDVPLTRMIVVFISGLALQSVIGLMQAFTKMRIGLPGEPFQPHYHLYRAVGMTFHPNVFAGYLIVGLLLSIPLLRRKKFVPIWWLLWATWYATASRSSAVALAFTLPIALIWFFWYQPTLRRTLLVALIGVTGTLWFADNAGLVGFGRYMPNNSAVPIVLQPKEQPPIELAVEKQPAAPTQETPLIPPEKVETATVAPRWLTTQSIRLKDFATGSYAINYRWRLNEIAFGILAARPLQGIGAGNFPLSMLGNTAFDKENGPHNTHNVTLLLASEVGIVGGGVWLFLSVLGVWWLARHWQAQNMWLIVGLCAWLALVGEGLFEYYPWGLETGRLLTMFVWAIIGRNLRTA